MDWARVRCDISPIQQLLQFEHLCWSNNGIDFLSFLITQNFGLLTNAEVPHVRMVAPAWIRTIAIPVNVLLFTQAKTVNSVSKCLLVLLGVLT